MNYNLSSLLQSHLQSHERNNTHRKLFFLLQQQSRSLSWKDLTLENLPWERKRKREVGRGGEERRGESTAWEGECSGGRGGETATLGGNLCGRSTARGTGSLGTPMEVTALKRQQKTSNLKNRPNSYSRQIQAPGLRCAYRANRGPSPAGGIFSSVSRGV